ncbi:DUF956 family protein, partial [Oenococcus oeni]
MVESINRKIDLVVQATSYMGLGEYGEIMIGDEGFEFFSDRDPRKFIQIPWKEVNLVVASLIFKGKWIPRYAIQTKHNGMFKFSSKHPKEVLRMVRKYIDPDHIVRSLTFFQVMRRNFKWLFG